MPVFFKALIPFFFKDLRIGFLFKTSLTTALPNSRAAGLAAFIKKGRTFLATPDKMENRPEPRRWGIPLGWIILTPRDRLPYMYAILKSTGSRTYTDQSSCCGKIELRAIQCLKTFYGAFAKRQPCIPPLTPPT